MKYIKRLLKLIIGCWHDYEETGCWRYRYFEDGLHRSYWVINLKCKKCSKEIESRGN